jgi:chromosome segregation ATPase
MNRINADLDQIREDKYEKKKKNLENEISKLEEDLKRSRKRINELTEMEDKYSEEIKKIEKETKEFEISGGSVNDSNFRLISIRRR